jgi:hypothetical protein
VRLRVLHAQGEAKMNGYFKLQLDGWAIGMFFCGWNVGGRLCDHADANKEPSWS